jgi:[protein-PII] uridylyltransferase
LVRRLVELVEDRLEGRPPPDTRQAELTAAERSLLGTGRLELLADGSALVVAVPDRPGLLATVAGVLTLSGASVLSATTMSDATSEMALLRFHVVPAFEELPEWAGVKSRMGAALDGQIDVDALLQAREVQYARHRRRTSAYGSEPRVMIDNEASSTATVVEVRAPDRGPLLYNIASALAGSSLTIDCALVSTLGAEAIDVFYVRDVAGGRVTDPARLLSMEEAILAAV